MTSGRCERRELQRSTGKEAVLIRPYPISKAEDAAAQAAVEHRENGAEARRRFSSGEATAEPLAKGKRN